MNRPGQSPLSAQPATGQSQQPQQNRGIFQSPSSMSQSTSAGVLPSVSNPAQLRPMPGYSGSPVQTDFLASRTASDKPSTGTPVSNPILQQYQVPPSASKPYQSREKVYYKQEPVAQQTSTSSTYLFYLVFLIQA